MADKMKDSTVQTTSLVAETAVLPEVSAIDGVTPVVEAARKPEKPSKAQVKSVAAAEVASAKTPDVAAPKATPAKAAAKTKPVSKSAEKNLPKARRAKPVVAAAPEPAVKPAAKRPFTATPRVKQNSAAPKTMTAPRKELFAMATTSTEITEKMTAAFKDAQDKAKAALEKSQAAFGDAGTFAKGNVEAMVESSKIFASGLQEMTKGYVAETKSVFETMTADVKDLTTVKSPTEFFEKQSALMRKNFDAAVAASSKNSEAMLKLANEAFQPISTRVSLAVEKIKHAA
ncbi:MAG: phasin [Novosphingobium sp. 17-62-19]|nr:MAG: phasin [Novosphingobium sp. 35-62-5]OZA19004.1 MAG: phasin [Novosphingobium sp. 17-62-19]